MSVSINNKTADELEEREHLRGLMLQLAHDSFYAYARLMGPYVCPGFKDGAHIKLICDALQEAYDTEDARLQVLLPPGSSKSILGSLLFPSWVFGRNPEWQILHIAHTFDFIAVFGGKIRDLLSTPEYLAVFPDVKLNDAYQSRDYWETTAQGVYRCAGAGSQIAGKRGHIGICDDLVSEQTYKSPAAMEAIQEWWPGGFESRLLEGGRIVLINTKWSLNDPAQWLLTRAAENPTLDQWKVIKIPAILTPEAAALLGHPEGTSYWPEVWKTETLLKKKAGAPHSQWMALYQQEPIALDGNIIKPENFQVWRERESPDLDLVIASLDTAYSIRSSADYSVIQIWGVFNRKRTDSSGEVFDVSQIILLNQIRKRMEYPDLLAKCAEVKGDYEPNIWVIEQKASGQSLIQDLRRRGYFVHAYSPGRGDDKVSRVHACTPFIDDKRVWIPDKVWSKDFRDECAAFPKGSHDDSVDAMTGAIIYLRDAFYLDYREDSSDEDENPGSSRKFYW